MYPMSHVEWPDSGTMPADYDDPQKRRAMHPCSSPKRQLLVVYTALLQKCRQSVGYRAHD